MAEPFKVVVFTVGREEYAIKVEHIISIEKIEGFTRIPHLPDYVRGIVKVRDELIPILDLEKVLYDQFVTEENNSRIIVLRTSEMSLGILVNEAKEILDIFPEQVKQLGLVAYKNTSYLIGIANLESRLITLIDPSQLVRSLEGIREIQEYMESQLQKQ